MSELRALVDAAHTRGMKVYFDIITNHTADVIGYEEGARTAYVPKDKEPYRTASGQPFDDRDYAGTNTFPPLARHPEVLNPSRTLDPEVSFMEPVPSSNLKVPSWLNDVTLYHNRGNTTFVSDRLLFYGDFFGNSTISSPSTRGVVDGMIGHLQDLWIRRSWASMASGSTP